jgi:hypothetical protein
MNPASPWQPAESTLPAICQQFPRPLDALAGGDIPAILLREFVDPSDCRQLVTRCISEKLLYDPDNPLSPELDRVSIPEGHYREGTSKAWAKAWGDSKEDDIATSRRIDIGTSLGYRGSDQDDYFAHSRATSQLLERLFSGMTNLVDVVYSALQELSVDKRVMTAREPDGRTYGPAIIRAHYGGYEYKPHFDSVKNRENRTNYSVYDFAHQFAGVVLLQNANSDHDVPQTRIHRCFWEPEIAPHLQENTFHQYAERNQIDNCDISLAPGDLYFFNTGCIHEVPGVDAMNARIVLAVFIGYSPEREEICVWS